MAIIKSGATSDTLTIDPTSKAARVTLYDSRGNSLGQKASYAASTAIKGTVLTGTGVWFAIYGSATKTVRVQRILATVTVATAAVYGDLVVSKRTVAISGGTSSALTRVPLDSNSSAATVSLVNTYSVAPTPGTGGGAIGIIMAFCPITATVTNGPGVFDFDWRYRAEMEAPVLRGTAQGLELNFGTTTTNAPTITVTVWWVEE